MVREVTLGEWDVLRDVRLAALKEAPYAFASTYAREAPFTREQWLGRLSRDDAGTFFAAAGWAKARHHDTLHLWVAGSNAPARKLYERCGFTPTGERQPLPSDPSPREIRMRRAL